MEQAGLLETEFIPTEKVIKVFQQVFGDVNHPYCTVIYGGGNYLIQRGRNALFNRSGSLLRSSMVDIAMSNYLAGLVQNSIMLYEIIPKPTYYQSKSSFTNSIIFGTFKSVCRSYREVWWIFWEGIFK